MKRGVETVKLSVIRGKIGPMSTHAERDDMAEIIAEAADAWLMGPTSPGSSPEGCAADALIAAGFGRKP